MKTKKMYTFLAFVILVIVASVFIYMNLSHKEEASMRGTFVFHNEKIEKGYHECKII